MGEGEYDLKSTKVVVNAPGVVLCGSDPKRVYLAFGQGAASGTAFLAVAGGGVQPPQYPLAVNGMLEFWFRRHGPMASYSWILSGGATPTTISVFELLKINAG